jgi:hypothetical protein
MKLTCSFGTRLVVNCELHWKAADSCCPGTGATFFFDPLRASPIYLTKRVLNLRGSSLIKLKIRLAPPLPPLARAHAHAHAHAHASPSASLACGLVGIFLLGYNLIKRSSRATKLFATEKRGRRLVRMNPTSSPHS